MSCDEYYASPSEYLDFWCVEIGGANEEDQVKNYLRRAASTINMARQAQGACDCTLSTASVQYLRDLSIVLAVVYHKCPCARPNLNESEMGMYIRQVSDELKLIRTGEFELCQGATGSDFPAIDQAERGWTAENAAKIIYNRLLRDG